MTELLKVTNISKRFGGIVAVNNLSFEIHKGETVGLSDRMRRQIDSR